MDFEDTTDTSDSQAVLVVEFNNQATLNHQETVDNVPINGLENNWDAELHASQSSSINLGLPIPLPCPVTTSSTSLFSETDHEGTFADDLEALFSSAENQADHLGDLLDVGAEAGVCGLRNLGNTCFMSTGVQCLMATPALVHCLLHQPTPAKDTLTSHLSVLTHKMWSGQYSAVQPSDFKETLGAHYPQFKDFRQHDCQEFLALLLDGLHEQMNSSSLQNKLQDMLESDCDMENTSKMLLKSLPNGMCKNLSPTHNNLKEAIDSMKTKTPDKNESLSCTPKLDKKINNCEVNEIETPETSYKLPLIVNKYESEEASGSTNRHDQMYSLRNVTKDSLPANILNNCSPRLSGFEDIIKDAKTSNVNVLVTEQEANNEIRFDSDKFPRSENVRRRETFNFNSFHLYENNMTSGKRGKSTVTHYKSTVDFREGLDLKRLKVQRNESQDEGDGDTIMDCDWEKNHRMEDERKHRVSSKNLDKNYRMECERRRRDGPGPSSTSSVAQSVRTEVDLEAEVHWQKHLAAHQSVIVDTFQGQFKSTVVCSKCDHVSVTYEPFMYLSVPLPHAMERQLSVTFVSAKESEPVQYLLTVNKRDTVGSLREQLLNIIGRPLSSVVLAEVLDYHIAKVLDENHLVRYINSTNRSLYAFELANFSHFSGVETAECDKVKAGEDMSGDACTICLEEKESNMSRHIGCTCILCDSCIVRSSQHYGEETLKCPVCRKELTKGDNLITVGLTPDTKPPVRMLNVSLVFRLDTVGDGNNNMRTIQLFGHPRLLRLPNRLQCQQLHEAVASVTPYSQPYKILLVDGQGHHCSRCMFNAHCRGCPVAPEGSLVLRAGDSLAAMFVEPVPELSVIQHSTMLRSAINNPLSLYDCIQAFSQSEVLDEHNPWYCPSCKKNQCATKTLSVWRYPNYLIIYLKRFVFQDCVSMKLDDKVTFPLCGLNLSPSSSLYDLYACVCHVGGVSAGHYTAYTQHPRTGEWHYYNDDFVTKQPPQDDDYSNAYILFYKKRGADIKNEDFNAKLISLNSESLS
ncbi:uncharacterized protein LOC124361861 isoform X3 [Homalodisca vitripennis]|uniref:uncharacterized protein LOC124361861 isoform X3 n=1 Tax=Homalodisca vitripennis TaxID=197043 RepID=UPI001EEA9D26|nr:uncharacterized protein LOC124361861 isoform X3 [Homalodisca vitripennis]